MGLDKEFTYIVVWLNLILSHDEKDRNKVQSFYPDYMDSDPFFGSSAEVKDNVALLWGDTIDKGTVSSEAGDWSEIMVRRKSRWLTRNWQEVQNINIKQ